MAYIRVYSGDELKKQFELSTDALTIGRTDDNDLVLADPGVSRQHAEIIHENGGYFILDRESRNGVFLNKSRIKREKLKYWDEIQIHNYVIKFMATSGMGAGDVDEEVLASDVELDKTQFISLDNQKQLDNLRQKSKQCYLTFKDQSGKEQKFLIKKPRIILGSSRNADIQIPGWFAPKVAAHIERQGGTYELVPSKRGKVIFKGDKTLSPVKLSDGSGFLVRNMEFKFFNRLTKTSE